MTTPHDIFLGKAPRTSVALGDLLTALTEDSALAAKEQHLAYLAALCATRMTSGLAFHVQMAQRAGASNEEITSACMVGYPAVGLQVLDGLRVAAEVLDAGQ